MHSAYVPLKKENYILRNQAAFQRLYEERLKSPATTRLDIEIAGHPAFFVTTPELLGTVAKILTTNCDIEKVKHELPEEAVESYFRKSLIEEITQTLDIEQITSTRKEIADAMGQRKADARLDGMISKYNALLSDKPVPLDTCQDVRKLYDEFCLPEVQLENPGDIPDGEIFRKGPVNLIGKADVVHEGLFPEARIIRAMEQSLAMLRDEGINALVRIAIFHYLFGYIHPFYDGNGRMSRFISSYLLARELDSLMGVRLSYTINARKKEYYRLFRETNDPRNMGDLTLFIHGFLAFVQEAHANLLRGLTERNEELKILEGAMKQLVTDKRLFKVACLLLQVSLFSYEGLREDEIAEKSAVGKKTVHAFLTGEATRDMFICERDGKRKLYTLRNEWFLEKLREARDALPEVIQAP